MKILLTGGAGDLAAVVAKQLTEMRYEVLLLDIRRPQHRYGRYINASIEDFAALKKHFKGVDCVVHIAAWHGIHENNKDEKKRKDAFDFFDLNVKGTFHVLEAAAQRKVPNVLFISSTSVDDPDSIYGNSKIMNEQMVTAYAHREGLNAIILRPRAFIPSWNPVYKKFSDWLKWFWKGAVHIDDVANSVFLAIKALSRNNFATPPVLTVDGAYEYTYRDLKNWQGLASFKKHYAEFLKLARKHKLKPARAPKRLNITATKRVLGWEPFYSLRDALEDLREYGEAGPPPPPWLKR